MMPTESTFQLDSAESGTALEQVAMLHALLDTAVDVFITIDEQGVIRQANAAVKRMFGYAPEELLGRNISLLMPEPHQSRHDQYISDYLATGVAKIIGIGREVMAVRKDGVAIPIDLAISESVVGGRRLFTGIIRDMSERNRVATALRREQHFSNDLLSTANAAIIVLDTDGRIVQINPFLESITGFTLAEVHGRDWFETFIPHEDRHEIRKVFESLLTDQTVHSLINPILTKQGTQRMIAWSKRRLHDCDEVVEGVLGIGTDITELHDAERKLIQSERLAAIGQMVTGLAHESRNALQRARACLDMLELDTSEQPAQLVLIHRAQHALDELQRLYDEVRNYAAPVKLELGPCDLASLCRETWDNLIEEHPSRKVQLRLIAEGGPFDCHCDCNRIQQVVRNILENALQVSPEGGEIEVTIEPVTDGADKYLRVRVRDQGPGLTTEQRERIFEPFFTTKTKGTGLGMAISRRILEAHGGEIAVADPPPPNSPFPGAEIVFVFPV